MSNTQIEPAFAAAMPAPQGGALPTSLEWNALHQMAETLAASEIIPYRLKRKPADVAVVLLAAREYGIPPLMALTKLPVVNGTPAPMGELMVALVLRAGHYIAADFRNPDGTVYGGGPLTPEHYGECRYSRRDWTEREALRFTLAEAIQAGLVTLVNGGKPRARDNKDQPTPWEQWTPNMARWRAVSNACRLAFADVLMGLSYLPEELGAYVDQDGAPVEGEVVHMRSVPTGTIEQRSAQEAAEKLAEQPWPPHVIEAVRETATEQGYVAEQVTYRGEPMTLAEALDVAGVEYREASEAGAEVVDAVVVEEQQQEAVEAVQEDQAEQPAPAADPALTLHPLVVECLGRLDAAQNLKDAQAVWSASKEVRDHTVTHNRHGTMALGKLIMAVMRDLAEAETPAAPAESPEDHGTRAAGENLRNEP